VHWMLLLLLTSCSFFQPSHKGDYSQYINSDVGKLAPTDEIRSALSRVGYMAGGEYEFKLTPYTESLIMAETRDLQKLRGFTDLDRKEIEKKRRIELVDGKVCIEVKLTIVRFKEASKIEDWQIDLVSSKDHIFPMRWREEDLRRKSVQSFFTGLYGQEAKWNNEGIACTNLDFDLTKGFHVRMRPKHVQWPFSDSTSMTWGLEELTFQTYRGY
jgi:hypothetical protein